ncbi:MAG: hypothetical protein OGMRLDGQ_000815, partial [Candidatus Fervidibacter sp.]
MRLMAVVSLTALTWVLAWGYPTSTNLTPSSEVMGDG